MSEQSSFFEPRENPHPFVDQESEVSSGSARTQSAAQTQNLTSQPSELSPEKSISPESAAVAPVAAGDTAAGSSGVDVDTAKPKAQPKKKKRKKSRITIVYIASIIILSLLLIALVAICLFSWDRWYRYDDESDIQGTWYVVGTSVPITINDDTLQFNETTSYAYSLDTAIKSIHYAMGNLEGEGHYWFENNRDILVLLDGSGFTRWGTAQDDAQRMIQRWLAGGITSDLYTGDEDVIILTRQSDVSAVTVEVDSANDGEDIVETSNTESSEDLGDSSGASLRDTSVSQNESEKKSIFEEVDDLSQE